MKKVYLLTTRFCMKCPSVKKSLENEQVPYEVVDAIVDTRWHVKSVPALVLEKDSVTEAILVGMENIKTKEVKEWYEEN